MSVLTAHTERAPSTTRVLLRRLRAVLVILTLLTGGAALFATIQEHAVVSAAGHAATADMQAAAAYQALADADSQAVQTIPRGLDPSGQYEGDIAAAEQSLELVAENNVAGVPGTRALQLTEGLIAAYTGLVEEAYGYFRTQGTGSSEVGIEDLWSASELMHQQILTGDDSVTFLETAANKALGADRSSAWASPWLSAVWIVPALALLGTLAGTQRVLYRRMRRVLSLLLTVAAGAVIALCVTAGNVIASEGSLAAASGTASSVVAVEQYLAAQSDLNGQPALARLLQFCGSCDATVGSQVNQWKRLDSRIEKTPLACKTGQILECESTYGDQSATAQAGYSRSMTVIGGLIVALLLLIPLRLSSYLDEYRFRKTDEDRFAKT